VGFEHTISAGERPVAARLLRSCLYDLLTFEDEGSTVSSKRRNRLILLSRVASENTKFSSTQLRELQKCLQ